MQKLESLQGDGQTRPSVLSIKISVEDVSILLSLA